MIDYYGPCGSGYLYGAANADINRFRYVRSVSTVKPNCTVPNPGPLFAEIWVISDQPETFDVDAYSYYAGYAPSALIGVQTQSPTTAALNSRPLNCGCSLPGMVCNTANQASGTGTTTAPGSPTGGLSGVGGVSNAIPGVNATGSPVGSGGNAALADGAQTATTVVVKPCWKCIIFWLVIGYVLARSMK